MSIKIHSILTKEQLSKTLLHELRGRRLSEVHFYSTPRAVAAWLRLCRSRRYPNYRRSLELCTKHADAIVAKLPGRAVQWISLGCGQGTKECPFLRACLRRGLAVRYVPVDASRPLLALACRQAAELGVPTRGLKADVTQSAHVRAIPARQAGEARVISMFGNSLGAFGRSLYAVLELLRPGDLLLVDGELFAGRATLVGYDHPANREFAMAPLRALGISPHAGRLTFSLAHRSGRLPVSQVRKQFAFRRPAEVKIRGETIRFRPGDVLSMSPSDKYDRKAMMAFLERACRLIVLTVHLSPDRHYALWACQR